MKSVLSKLVAMSIFAILLNPGSASAMGSLTLCSFPGLTNLCGPNPTVVCTWSGLIGWEVTGGTCTPGSDCAYTLIGPSTEYNLTVHPAKGKYYDIKFTISTGTNLPCCGESGICDPTSGVFDSPEFSFSRVEACTEVEVEVES